MRSEGSSSRILRSRLLAAPIQTEVSTNTLTGDPCSVCCAASAGCAGLVLHLTPIIGSERFLNHPVLVTCCIGRLKRRTEVQLQPNFRLGLWLPEILGDQAAQIFGERKTGFSRVGIECMHPNCPRSGTAAAGARCHHHAIISVGLHVGLGGAAARRP
jgi:hypothetical protein